MALAAPRLTDQQKGHIYACVSVGCDRAAACKVARCTMRQLRNELEQDTEFSEELLRLEGATELHRMRTLHNAAKEEKHWRAATWWLEQKAKKRFSRRQAKQVTTVELQQYLGEMIDLMFSEVASDEDRDRVVARLSEMAHAIQADLPAEEDEQP